MREKGFYDGSRLPVRRLPSTYRLATGAVNAAAIAERADAERRLQEHNRRVIREAITYTPQFAYEIGAALEGTQMLLLAHGYEPQPQAAEEGVKLDDVVEDKLDPSRKYRQPKPEDTATVTALRRDLARVLHPDRGDTVVTKVLSTADQTAALKAAAEASRTQDPRKAQDAYLQTMPQYLSGQVCDLLASGMSFEEIDQTYPQIADQLDFLQYVAHIRLPKPNSYRQFAKPEDADREATCMKRKKDLHARTIGIGLVLETTGAVVDFGSSAGVDPSLVEQMASVRDYMEETGGWIGGAGEFELRQGSRVVTGYVRSLGTKVDDSIRALPDRLHAVAEGLVDGVDAEQMATLLQQLRDGVISVRTLGRRYGQAMVDVANGRVSEKLVFGGREKNLTMKNPKYSKEKIYKDRYYNNNKNY